MDDLFSLMANHPLVVLAAGIILVLVLMKSFKAKLSVPEDLKRSG